MNRNNMLVMDFFAILALTWTIFDNTIINIIMWSFLFVYIASNIIDRRIWRSACA